MTLWPWHWPLDQFWTLLPLGAFVFHKHTRFLILIYKIMSNDIYKNCICSTIAYSNYTPNRFGCDIALENNILPIANFGVLWLWHFLYRHIQCQASIYTLLLCRGHSWLVGLPSRRHWHCTWSHLWFAGVRECLPWCSIVGATVTVHQFFCILINNIGWLVI